MNLDRVEVVWYPTVAMLFFLVLCAAPWWAPRLGRWIDGEAHAGTAVTGSAAGPLVAQGLHVTSESDSPEFTVTLSEDGKVLTIARDVPDDLRICVEVPFTIDTSGQRVTVCRTVKELREGWKQ